ncbi:MAG: helix-turn-helix domain-containing protein [Deltaproteobacteria bacterium]|jgi:putative transposase|nr:helix-turn-helix domain-containing protein [Deltaproteobacteria bacterium]
MRQAVKIVLTPEEKAKLERLLKNPKTPRKILERAQIVTLAAMGRNNESIAKTLDFSEARVGKWRTRFAENRLAGIELEAPRSGRPASVRDTLTSAVIEKTLYETPPDPQKIWSTRLLAKALGISHTSVHRIWQTNHLAPRRNDAPFPPDHNLKTGAEPISRPG